MTAQPALPFEYRDTPRFRLSLVRESSSPYADADRMQQPAQAARWLWDRIFRDAPAECMVAVYLDTRNAVIGYSVVYTGTLNRSVCEPRGILAPAMLCNAAGVLLAHNHPSGDPSPSAEDMAFTRRLAEAGEIMGIRLSDHLIIGDAAERFVSLRATGAVVGAWS